MAYSKFIGLLKQKTNVFKIDRFYPSSKTCSNCGYVYDLSLKERTWRCPVCDTIHDRDENAAVNIYKQGNLLIDGASSIGVDTARPAYAGGYR